MKIVVIDGQGGKLGRIIIERLMKNKITEEIIAVGTNSTATSNMLKSGAKLAATGENAVIVNARNADIIVAPIAILIADGLLGEITPAMAVAAGQSSAKKILIPSMKCNTIVAGTRNLTIDQMIDSAVEEVMSMIKEV